jgi:hypothetical protein
MTLLLPAGTLLMLASYNGNPETGRMLLAHGASLRRHNLMGLSASFMVRVSRWIPRLFPRSQFQNNNVP